MESPHTFVNGASGGGLHRHAPTRLLVTPGRREDSAGECRDDD